MAIIIRGCVEIVDIYTAITVELDIIITIRGAVEEAVIAIIQRSRRERLRGRRG